MIGKKGLTLIEFLMAMIITAIIVLTLAVYYLSEFSFRRAAQLRIELNREARIAMNHMSTRCRFAKSGTLGYGLLVYSTQFTIEGGHLASYPHDKTVAYLALNNAFGLPGSGPLFEWRGTDPNLPSIFIMNDWQILADKIESFSITPNVTTTEDDSDYSITVTASEGNQSVTLQTTIRSVVD